MEEYYQIANGILKCYTGREESIEVPQGIHTIGEGALKGCVSLKKVVLPSGLRYIMQDAFKGCRRLEEVNIPDGVQYIGPYAFHRCHALKQAILPLSVQELGECAFLYCDSLKEIQIPGVKRIGMAALANGMALEKLVISRELDKDCICDVFTGCARVREIAFADGEAYSIPNVVEVAAGMFPVPSLIGLIVKDILLRMMEFENRTLIRFRVNIKHVEVPEGIEILAKSSFFDMRGILEIKLPKSLKRIESRAFRNCIGLEKVVLGGDAVCIDKDVFRNCTSLRLVSTCDGAAYLFSGLSDIHRIQPKTAENILVSVSEVPEPVRVIHKQVLGNFRISGTILLQYLGSESRVIIPDGITRIAEEAFAGNETIDKVIFPESLQEIGAEAFRGCLLMQTVTLPKSLCKIGTEAFADCVKLLRIEIPEQINVLEDKTFRQCQSLQEVFLPESLQKIGESVFYGCQSLKKIELPKGLIGIEKMAFYRSGLREIRIPAKTKLLGNLAFAKSRLRKVWISGDGYETGKQYGVDVFGDCAGLKTLMLEEGVCSIPDKFAYNCPDLSRVMLPKTLKSIGRHALEGSIFLAQKKQHTQETESAILWDGLHLEGEVWIPEYVRTIAGGAFYGNTKITTVHLPNQIQSIGAAAFKGCTALRQVDWPCGITHLETEVFCGCMALEEVLLTDGAENKNLPAWRLIGERAFYQCEKLHRVQLEQIQEIGKEAFRGCAALSECAVNPMIRVGERAFADTLFGERLENGLHIVGNVLVSGTDCSGVLCVPGGIQGIAPYAFAGNHALIEIIFPESLWWIGEGAFFGCRSLLNVVFSQKLHRIDAHAFEKCSALKEIVCYANEIGEGAFAGCIALFRVRLSQIEILEKRLFAGCINLKECLCEKGKEAGQFCFSGCTKLKDYDFAVLNQVGEYAFAGCESLKYAKFQDGVCLKAHALEDCSRLEKICLSGQQGTIVLSEYSLSGCTALCQVVYQGKEWRFVSYTDILLQEIPETVRLLFHSAFSCFAVEQEENLVGYRGAAARVRIPAGIRRIEAEVFQGAMLLEQIEIPESVEYIGARAFHKTAWMTDKRKKSPMVTVRDMLLDGSSCVGDITIPANIRLVCGWAFANGLEITSIHFLSERVQVEEYAFRNCINLQELILPDGMDIHFTGLADRTRELPPLAKQAVLDSMNCFKTNEEGVLMECTGNIPRLRLVDGITQIGEGAFQDANLLTTVTFSRTVKKIQARAFAGCKWLCEVKQAYHVECIEARAFSGCGNLRLIELSENLRQIGAGAFENCTSLESIQIPEGVEEIPERAFYRCHNLRRVQLPSTIKRIGKEAFAFCRENQEIGE